MINIRSLLSGLKIVLNQNPKLADSEQDWRRYIPQPYKAVCLISADFEMAWAFCHSKLSINDPERAIKKGLKTRVNVTRILDICDNFKIPITWATVGHLFLDKCTLINGTKHPDLKRIPFFKNEFWLYDKGDWYDNDPCTDINTDPAWYGKDLIKDILSRKVNHEIGCHSYSHIDCSDDKCPSGVFEAEIKECIRLAEDQGVSLKSFVHPGHQIGHLKELSDFGFESYRTDYGNTLSLPIKVESGLWQLKNSSEINYKSGWSAGFNLYRYKKLINRAIRHHRVAVLWFHPSCGKETIEKVLKPLFKYLNKRKMEILITTHYEYTNYLNKQSKESEC